jgi:hypothetical protein
LTQERRPGEAGREAFQAFGGEGVEIGVAPMPIHAGVELHRLDLSAFDVGLDSFAPDFLAK